MNNDRGTLIKSMATLNNKYFVENTITVCMLCDLFVLFWHFVECIFFFKNFAMYIVMNTIYVFPDTCIVFNNYDLHFMRNIKSIVRQSYVSEIGKKLQIYFITYIAFIKF